MATSQLNGVIRQLRRAALLRDDGEMTDRQLLEGFIARRDEAAFEVLVRRHGPMVLGVCRRVLRNPHDAQDAFQAAFLVLVRKAASIKQRALLGNWLYGVAYRTALDARAAAARRRIRERQVSAMPEPEAVERAEVGPDLRPLLDQELSRLPEKYRVPIVLCDLQGRSRREVARQLGIPDGTLSGRLTTARRTLARRLARLGVTLAGGAVAMAMSESMASASVPAPLVVSTVQVATVVAAGSAAAGAIPANVAALTEGVLKAMLLSKLKIATAWLLAVGVVAGGALGLRHQTLAQEVDAQQQQRAIAAQSALGANRVEAEAAEQPRDTAPAAANSMRGAVNVKIEKVDAEQGTLTVVIGQVRGINAEVTVPKLRMEGVSVAKRAKIFLNDKEVKLADLKSGMWATLKLEVDSALWISEIDAVD